MEASYSLACTLWDYTSTLQHIAVYLLLYPHPIKCVSLVPAAYRISQDQEMLYVPHHLAFHFPIIYVETSGATM